jgi:nucleotide-binding universal stress UspA family protein
MSIVDRNEECRISSCMTLNSVPTTFPDFLPETRFLEKLRKDAERNFAACETDLRAKGIKVSSCIEGGNDVAGTIVDVIDREKIDFVVVSTHGVTGWDPMSFGSIAEKLVKLVQCPPLLLRTAKPASSVKHASARLMEWWSRTSRHWIASQVLTEHPLRHLRLELDHLAIHSEFAVSVMVDCLWILSCPIDPSLQDLQNEEIEPVDETSIDYLAFEIREAFSHEGRRHALGSHRRQSKSLEFVHVTTRTVAYRHYFARQFKCRNSDHAFLCRLQSGKAVISVADNTCDKRRLEFNHRVPGHCHDIRASLVSGRQQGHWAGFK